VCDLKNLKNEEAMTRVGSQRHKKKKFLTTVFLFSEYRMRSDDDGTQQRTGKETPVILFQYSISSIVRMEIRSCENPE
jgi:hypothetical protein